MTETAATVMPAGGSHVGFVTPSGNLSRLSRSEVQILRLLATGRTRHLVAHELGLSPSTVRGHLDRIFHRLDQTTLVGTYAKLGWLVVPEEGS